MKSPPRRVKAFLDDHRAFLVLGHREPDGDCVASQLVLCDFLLHLGKRAIPLSVGPFDRPEIAVYAGRFRARLEAGDGEENTAAVVVDCSTPDRTGILEPWILKLPTLVIDHHASGQRFGTVRWILPQAPSVTFMIFRLIESCGMVLSAEQAQLLLFGLVTDTGFFRHLEAGSAETFKAAARLVKSGASPKEAYLEMHGGQSLQKMRLLGGSLARAEELLGGRLILTWQFLADSAGREVEEQRGSGELYRLLQMVRGVEAVVFVKEESPGTWSVGLRSLGRFDVGAIALSMGGGGHRQAAGFNISGTAEEVRGRLRKLLASRL